MPKKLVGGVFLLCLTAMTLTLSEDGETFTNITQPEILEQLTNLKTYVSNPKMIKPVWVQLKNGDEIVVVQGELKVVDTGEFEIIVAINGYKLLIHIEFTQALNEDEQPIDDWYIAENDAKYLFTSDAQNIGAISELPVFENIVDAQGHKRFIEGDINIEEIIGVTKTYGKWSLSGTHLLLVLCVNVLNETTITVPTYLSYITLPEWIFDKIVQLSNAFVDRKSFSMVASSWDSQPLDVVLQKSNNKLALSVRTAVTSTADRDCRIAFDLLIDNATPESQGE